MLTELRAWWAELVELVKAVWWFVHLNDAEQTAELARLKAYLKQHGENVD